MSRRLFHGQLADEIAGEDRPRAERLRRLARELVGVVRDGLVRDGQVRIAGFGTFRLSPTKARKGINPRTGERIDIPARYRVLFRPAKALRERIEPGWAPAVPLAEPHASREASLGGVMSEAPAAGTLPTGDESRYRPGYFPDRIAAAAMADTVVRVSEPAGEYRSPASGSREANLGGTMGESPSAGRVPPRPPDRRGPSGTVGHGRPAANEEEVTPEGSGSREAELGAAASDTESAFDAEPPERSAPVMRGKEAGQAPVPGGGARADASGEPVGRGSRESTLADGSAASRAAGGLPEEDLPWEDEPSGESRHRTVPSTQEGPPRPPLDESGTVSPEGSREAALKGRVPGATPAGGGLPPEERPDAETSADWVAEPEPAPQRKVIVDESLEPWEPGEPGAETREERPWGVALLALLLLALLIAALAWWFWPRPEVPVAGPAGEGVTAEAEPGTIERAQEPAAESSTTADAGTAAAGTAAEGAGEGEPAAATADEAAGGAADTVAEAPGGATDTGGETAAGTAGASDRGGDADAAGATADVADGTDRAAAEAPEATDAAGTEGADTGAVAAQTDAGAAAAEAPAAAEPETAATTAAGATADSEATVAEAGAGESAASTEAGEAVDEEAAAAATTAEAAESAEAATSAEAAQTGTPWFSGRAYAIRRGDTLWDIADGRYVNPYYWPHIWNHNAGIADPDVIEIDQRLWLPTLEGEPRSLTATDRRSIAEGYLRLYRLWKADGSGNPQYALVGVRYFDPSVMPPELRNDPSAGRPNDALAAAFAALLEAEFPRQR